MSTQDTLDEVERQLESAGVATIVCKDGRLLYLTVRVLKELLAAAREKDSDRVALFIQNRSSLS